MIHYVIVGILLVGNIFVWLHAFPSHVLTVSFLDIGQGDSIFIEGPTGAQVLVDGGPGSSVLRELGSRMPFFDRSIDAVIESHPDKDHIGGLSDVIRRYDVSYFMEPGIPHDTSAAAALERALNEEEGLQRGIARRGMRLLLGGGAYADILFPDRDVQDVETNTGSIVMRVVYGENEFLLNGDSPVSIEKYLVALDAEKLQSDVLKAGHHGSRTSSSEIFVNAVRPKYAVFSRGCNNSYGHPHAEVVTLFQKLRIPTLDTCKEGTITFSSDGQKISF